MFYRDERLALFIDGSNLYAAARALGFDIDYKLLRSEFLRRGKLVRAYYYTALLEDQEYSPIRPLVDWLDYNGFTMVTKPAKEFINSMGRRKVKGNMDIELAVDAMEMADRMDHMVLFSGDGDFKPLIAAVQRKGVRVSVVSTIRSQPPMIADDLRRQADNFIELEELKDVIGRPPRPSRNDDAEFAAEPAEIRGRVSVYGAEAPPDCRLCPRLAGYLDDLRIKHPGWRNAPVESFGDPEAELLVVGLAPGVTGANRTGRPFTGDYAGDLLYATLTKFGWANGAFDARPDDGLVLTGVMVTNAVRCVPPQNKPVGAEINACRGYLKARIAALPRLRAILCLGGISHQSTLRALGARVAAHPFGHGARHEVGGFALWDSYHCSRYNTNTGRLTTGMFETVFDAVRAELG